MNRLDPHNMHQMISSFPNQFADGFAAAKLPNLTTPSNVVVTGMGGSALPADLVQAAFSEQLPHPIIVSRSYGLPPHTNSDTLVIAISFSGNTEETISAYNTAKAIGAQVVVVTTGGKLLELAQNNQDYYIQIPKPSEAFQPRMASGYIFSIIVAILTKASWLAPADTEIMAAAKNLQNTWAEDLAKTLIPKLQKCIPLVYTSDTYWPVARIGKIKFNENSKIPAFWNVFPELNHNEMVGFTNSQAHAFHILALKDPTEDPRVNQRIGITAEVLSKVNPNIQNTVIDMVGKTKIEKIFNSLLLLDWTSYYLAISNNIDPTPVALVEDFKAQMSAKVAV